MDITQLLKDIREKEAESAIDVSSMNPGIQSTAEGLKRNAAEQLIVLTDQYKDHITKRCAIIAVSGSGASKYAQIAVEAGWLAVDFDGISKKISASLKKRCQSESFGNQEWWLFLDELNQMKVDYKIYNLPQPTINHTTDDVYEKTIEKAVDNLLKKNYSYSLHSAITKRVIGQMAFDQRFDKEFLPVVLFNCAGVDQNFLPQPLSVITVEEDIDPKEIMEHIEAEVIKHNMGKAKTKTTPKQEVKVQVRKPRKTKET